METIEKKKSSFVNVIAWLMMGLGALGFVIGSFQLFFFTLVMPDDFVGEFTQQPIDAIDFYVGFMFSNLPYLISILLVVYVLQIVVGFGLWKRKSWAWKASIAVFSVILLGTIVGGIGQQILYHHMFTEFPDSGLDKAAFISVKLIFHLVSGFMMLAFASLWTWILYRLSRPEIRAEFV